jgi:predicted DNA-binding protein
MRTRDVTVSIRLSKEEKQRLETLANESGYTQAGYLISLFWNKRPRSIPSIEYFTFINQLRSIGNNLNQIASKANALNFIDTKSYYQEVNKLHTVIKEIEIQMQLPERIEFSGNNRNMESK